MEFRHIVLTNVRAKYLASLLLQTQAKVGLLERLVTDRDSAVSVADSSIRILQGEIEEQKPAWIDRFMIGFPAGIVTVVALVIFLK